MLQEVTTAYNSTGKMAGELTSKVQRKLDVCSFLIVL